MPENISLWIMFGSIILNDKWSKLTAKPICKSFVPLKVKVGLIKVMIYGHINACICTHAYKCMCEHLCVIDTKLAFLLISRRH